MAIISIENQPLKILMVLHMPWDRNLGGSRVQLELAEEFQAMGHHVEKFDINDAFPHAKPSLIASLTRPSFSVKAKAFVCANAHRFDIIDAHQGNLPFSKKELGFQGLLIARSVGLHAFYEEYFRQERQTFPTQNWKLKLLDILLTGQRNRERPLYPRSFQYCDLINLPNRDELAYVRDVMGWGEKARVFPFGISRSRQAEFANIIPPARLRLTHPTVAFIGTWSGRKGARDWREIIQRVRQQIPNVRFHFLGTSLHEKAVLADLQGQEDIVKIVPQYNSSELPQLLRDVTVGAFPSYIEGFGFAVLEKLACGIPTVVYDVPGPREMLCYLDESWRVAAGDIEGFSDRIVRLLQQNEISYAQLSQQCVDVTAKFTWDCIARDTLTAYLGLG
ncbi:glycosyltransferase [Oscillatoria sp. FACHB-1406]|uniref:glycosyltransferase family 4 protein n=1 Tax=Oscillatoria sp. FACHB-1406 TaxID=2692846 RepID=UPI0016847C3A|nr:glycosyltransferase [Oscillatoria sp. FACHB-1406]MBD2578959.1 glycosyltransferase [Oscillatoria sp. FACHB-1406]